MKRRDFLQCCAAAGAAAIFQERFAWALSGASAGPLRIAFLTDLHTLVGEKQRLALQTAARRVNAAGADLIIGGGDFITDGMKSSLQASLARWDGFGNFRSLLRPPLYPVIGNHDYSPESISAEDGGGLGARQQFLSHFKLDRTFRSVEIAGVRFFFLDSIVQAPGAEQGYRAAVGAEQLQWLAGELATISSAMPLIVVSHAPLETEYFRKFFPDQPAPDHLLVANTREVLDLFSGHNLVAVLQGHLHVNEFFFRGRTAFITGGAICGAWWNGAWRGTEPGFGVLTLARTAGSGHHAGSRTALRARWEYQPLGS